jgi:hypothetical protein
VLLADFLAYGAGFTGGVQVGAGKFEPGARKQILTGVGVGGGPDVRIFRYTCP